MALGTQTQGGKFAIRKLQRTPEGNMKVIFIDPSTGEIVSNLNGYQIIDGENQTSLEDLGLDPNKTKDPDKDLETTSDVVKETIANHEGTKDNGGGSDREDPSSARSTNRDESNNYGYIDKPTGFGLAAGLFGMPGQLVDKGINFNNAIATNEAREAMGLASNGLFGFAKDTMMGSKGGYVADVNIGKNQYAVGLEALDPNGRTTLTPNEARNRGLVTGQPLTQASKSQVKDSVKSFKDEYKTSPGNTIAGGLAGNISDLVSGVGNFFSDLLGGVTNAFNPNDTPQAQGLSDFPDAPQSASDNSRGFSDLQSTLDTMETDNRNNENSGDPSSYSGGVGLY